MKQLANALVNLAKKVQTATNNIFKHEIFEELIAVNNEGKYDGLLDKIVKLIALLNYGIDEAYHF